MPKIEEMCTDGSKNQLLLVKFQEVTETWRKCIVDWLKRQYGEIIHHVRWRSGDPRVLRIEIRLCELGSASIGQLMIAIKRRSCFKAS